MIIKNIYYRAISTKTKKEYFKNNAVIKINFGCGGNALEGWLNCDLYPGPKICYVNCTKKLPFDNSSVDYIYTEHMIEHMSLNQAIDFLKESWRILKPFGRSRVVTPNLKAFFDLYNGASDQEMYLRWYKNRKNLISPILFTNCINSIFYEHGHEFIYDYDYLKELMKYCGFKKVQLCKIQKSSDPVFQNLESHGKVIGEKINEIESLVIEATK